MATGVNNTHAGDGTTRKHGNVLDDDRFHAPVHAAPTSVEHFQHATVI